MNKYYECDCGEVLFATMEKDDFGCFVYRFFDNAKRENQIDRCPKCNWYIDIRQLKECPCPESADELSERIFELEQENNRLRNKVALLENENYYFGMYTELQAIRDSDLRSLREARGERDALKNELDELNVAFDTALSLLHKARGVTE